MIAHTFCCGWYHALQHLIAYGALVVVILGVLGAAYAFLRWLHDPKRISTIDMRAMHGNADPGSCECPRCTGTLDYRRGPEIAKHRELVARCDECGHEHETVESTHFGDMEPTFVRGDCWVPGCMHESAVRQDMRRTVGR